MYQKLGYVLLILSYNIIDSYHCDSILAYFCCSKSPITMKNNVKFYSIRVEILQHNYFPVIFTLNIYEHLRYFKIFIFNTIFSAEYRKDNPRNY